jgi:hypothetical protein
MIDWPKFRTGEICDHLTAAEVLSSLPPATIAKVLAALPVEQQRKIIAIADSLADNSGRSDNYL